MSSDGRRQEAGRGRLRGAAKEARRGTENGESGESRHITRQSAQPTTMPKNEEKRATGIA